MNIISLQFFQTDSQLIKAAKRVRRELDSIVCEPHLYDSKHQPISELLEAINREIDEMEYAIVNNDRGRIFQTRRNLNLHLNLSEKYVNALLV